MDKDNIEKTSEDMYADVDFDEDADELKDAEFVGITPNEVKLEQSATEKSSKFFDENKKLVAEKIIEKKSGKIVEIKYDILGKVHSIRERDKNKNVKKYVEYHANGTQKMVNNYGPNGSYKSMLYNPDGSWVSFVDKHEDGTADAVYYDADNKGSKLIVKMDANKNVIEKRIER